MPAPTLVKGAPCWIDLFSSDTDRAKEFYGELFGWTTLDPGPEYGGYFIFQKDGKAVAGCMGNDGEQGSPDAWTIYLNTDDADRTAADAAAKGAQVHVEPMDVTQNGRFTDVSDPGGAAIGAWQPREVKGFEIRGEPGTAAWFELHTRRLRARGRLLPRRLRLGDAHRGRHGRLPLHDPGRGRGRARRDHGLDDVRARGLARRVDGLLRGRGRRRHARADRRAGREGRAGGRGHAVRPPRCGDAIPRALASS